MSRGLCISAARMHRVVLMLGNGNGNGDCNGNDDGNRISRGGAEPAERSLSGRIARRADIIDR